MTNNITAILALLGNTDHLSQGVASTEGGFRAEERKVAQEEVTTEVPAEVVEEEYKGEEVFPLELEIDGYPRKIELVHGTKEDPNILKVLLDEVEVAVGFITSSGPKIKIENKAFKHRLFTKDMPEEVAFKHVMKSDLIKTFKMK